MFSIDELFSNLSDDFSNLSDDFTNFLPIKELITEQLLNPNLNSNLSYDNSLKGLGASDQFFSIEEPKEGNYNLDNLYDWYLTKNPDFLPINTKGLNIMVPEFKFIIAVMSKDLLILKKTNKYPQKNIKNTEESMDENSVKREYLEETEIGDRMVDIALEMNQLHFDCAEVFHPIKEGLSEDEYEVYKKHKRNFYAMVSYFYNIKRDNKNEIFHILLKAVKMQSEIYSLDEELKGLKG